MTPPIPVCCSVKAFDAINSIALSIDKPQSLLPAAIAIAQHSCPDATLKEAQRRLDGMANVIGSRVRSPQIQARFAHLHQYLFEELGFEGNSADYYNPDNSLFPRVLRTCRGVPITLSLLYKLVAERIGLNVWGIGLPGHFVVGADMGDASVIIDPFAAGRLLTPDEARFRVQNQFGDQVEWSARLLEPVSNRYWITRILQNLLASYSKAGQYEDVCAVLEMEILLWPDEVRVQRDLAVALARLGKQDSAFKWLEYYLQNNPEDPNRDNLRQLLLNLS